MKFIPICGATLRASHQTFGLTLRSSRLYTVGFYWITFQHHQAASKSTLYDSSISRITEFKPPIYGGMPTIACQTTFPKNVHVVHRGGEFSTISGHLSTDFGGADALLSKQQPLNVGSLFEISDSNMEISCERSCHSRIPPRFSHFQRQRSRAVSPFEPCLSPSTLRRESNRNG